MKNKGTVKAPPEKYEVFVGNELSVQAIWKIIYPACPGEDDLAAFLTNRAYSRGITPDQLKGKKRDDLVKIILTDGADENRPKKRWELYKDYHEAWEAHQKDGVCMNVTWAFAGWLYMDVIEGESRLDYLKRCEAVRILKGNGYKELARLEKTAKKIGGAK